MNILLSTSTVTWGMGKGVERYFGEIIKEQACRVRMANAKEANCSNSSCGFKLPDGSTIEIAEHITQCPELLFCPDNNGIEGFSLPKAVMQCWNGLESSFAGEAEAMEQMRYTVLAGGSSLLPQ